MADELSGKRLVILGLARQGKAMARFAVDAGADVVISDTRSEEMLRSELEELADMAHTSVLGAHPMSLLNGTDVLAISGGVPADLPLVQSAHERGIAVTNDSHEFMKRVRAVVIGITGSAGKTTTTALTGAMIQRSGRTVWVGGNIGRPLITDLYRIEPNDIVVQELSSFQLEQWTMSPPIAALLNLTPNHLDRHKTMEAYRVAKSSILRYQSPDDVAVLSADDPGAQGMKYLVRGRLRQFSIQGSVDDGACLRDEKIWLRDTARERLLCDIADIPLRGRHNLLNVLAASVLADSAGVAIEPMVQAIRSFEPVEHRLEPVATIDGVQYINDSIATSPERAIAALNSFDEPLVLLAGGRDKQMVWQEWAQRVSQRAKAVILFGDLAPMMAELLVEQAAPMQPRPQVIETAGMADALRFAADLAEPGDIVLLSPGGTSFDSFVDFAERGELFRRLVRELSGEVGKGTGIDADH